MRNGKWGNGEMGRRYIAFYSANCWHFASAVIKGKSMSMHVITHREIIFPWELAPKGYATALHHSLQANSVYKFFTFGNLLLAISWNLLNLWIVHTLFQLYTRSHFEASSCSCLHCYGYTYICLTYSTTIKTACTIQTCCIYIQQNFRSSQNACCSHSSVDTHTGWIRPILCMHWVEEEMYNSFIPEWDNSIYCLTK